MSKTFRVSTTEKKSVASTKTFRKNVDGVQYEAELEIWYRWGNATISEVETESELTEHNTLEITNYDIQDQQLDDVVSSYWYYGSNVLEEMKAEVEATWGEDGYEGLEDSGWSHIDTETFFHGPLEVQFIGEEDDRIGETIASKSDWPF